MASKITKLFLTTLVISLGFGQLLRFEMSGIPIYLHDLLVAAILLTNVRSLPAVLKSFKVLKIFILGILVSSLSALYLYPLSSLLVPSLYSLRLLSYLSLFFFLKNSNAKISQNFFLAASLITTVIGLTQYLLLPDMRWAQYLGWDDHLNRLTLPHYDPTFTGVMLILTLLTLPFTTHRYRNIRYSIYDILILLSILLTYARSVWLSILITILTMSKSLKYIIIFTIIFVLAIVALPDRFGEGTNLLRTYSITSRVGSDLGYVKKYSWSLLTGRGLNTIILDQKAGILPNHATGPNNSYLYLLSTTGIIGLLGWGIFMKSLYKGSVNKPMLTFFFIASLFNNVMFYPFALLWILLAELMAPNEA